MGNLFDGRSHLQVLHDQGKTNISKCQLNYILITSMYNRGLVHSFGRGFLMKSLNFVNKKNRSIFTMNRLVVAGAALYFKEPLIA